MVTCDSVINTNANDAENQSLLCAEIMRRGLDGKWLHCARVKLLQSGKRIQKLSFCTKPDFVFILICYKLILSVFFIKYIRVLGKFAAYLRH